MEIKNTKDEQGNFESASLEGIDFFDLRTLDVALGIALNKYDEWGYNDNPKYSDLYNNFKRLRTILKSN